MSIEYGMVFNADKCSISVKHVSFFRLIYSEEGTPPYMSPNITELLAHQRELTHMGIIFQMSPSHQAAFEGIKENLCHDSSLAYFDAREPTTIQVDASGVGLGAVLFQNNHPSRSHRGPHTNAERRYSNIER